MGKIEEKIATIVGATAMALLVGGLASPAASLAGDSLQFELTPSSQQLSDCMPDASLEVTLRPNTD